MQKCDKCQREHKVLVKVRIYDGYDKDWGHGYSDAKWCMRCLYK